MPANTEILDAYLDMMQNRIAAGFSPYLLTFMFKQMGGSERTIAARMTSEVERVYSVLLTRLIKRPHATANNGKPLLIGALDWPVQKNKRQSIQDATQNEGMHFHANFFVPPITRNIRTLEEIVERHLLAFVGPAKLLTRLHVARVENNTRYVLGYGLKSVERRRIGQGDIIILPKHSSEL
jgi:hypothetical protein